MYSKFTALVLWGVGFISDNGDFWSNQKKTESAACPVDPSRCRDECETVKN